MAIELITGRYGTAHIGSEDVRAYQAYTAGSGRYVLHGGGASIQSANDVHLNPAEILIDGAHVRITGQGEDVTLENGASSYNRVDIVALHYLMTGSGDAAVESISLEVVKGTPSELTPSDPEMPASGSILDNVSETYVPYVRVLIQGLTPQTPEVLLPDYVNPADPSGDGEQVNPSVLVNLGSDSADTVFKASPRPGVTGTLPVSKGGTGATDVATALSNLRAAGLENQVKSAYVRSHGGNGQDRVTLFMTDNSGNNAALAGYDEFVGLFLNGIWKWQLFPDAAVNGVFKSGRSAISDLSYNTLYNLAPGTYLVANNATSGPESGNYGNLLVSYSAGNRIVGLLAYDNGHVYTTYGASASGTFLWTRIDVSACVSLLWSGSSAGSVTLAESVAGYRAIAVSIGGTDGVVEGTTLVWSPNGKTFDVNCAMIVDQPSNPWRAFRMRFTASGASLSCSSNFQYDMSGNVVTGGARLLNVVGIR